MAFIFILIFCLTTVNVGDALETFEVPMNDICKDIISKQSLPESLYFEKSFSYLISKPEVVLVVNLNLKPQDHIKLMGRMITSSIEFSNPSQQSFVFLPEDNFFYRDLQSVKRAEIIFLLEAGRSIYFPKAELEKLEASLSESLVRSEIFLYDFENCGKDVEVESIVGFPGLLKFSKLFREAKFQPKVECGNVAKSLNSKFRLVNPSTPDFFEIFKFDPAIFPKVDCLLNDVGTDVFRSVRNSAAFLDEAQVLSALEETKKFIALIEKDQQKIPLGLIEYQFRMNVTDAFFSVNEFISYQYYFDANSEIFETSVRIRTENLAIPLRAISKILRRRLTELRILFGFRNLILYTDDKFPPEEDFSFFLETEKEVKELKKLLEFSESIRTFCKEGVLEIVGTRITLQDVEMVEKRSKNCPHHTLLAIAYDNFFFGGEVTLHGMNLVVFSPKWHITTMSGVSLSGKPGQNGGHFVGYGSEIVGWKLIQVLSNGGPGLNGRDAPPEIRNSGLVTLEGDKCVKSPDFDALWPRFGGTKGGFGGLPGKAKFFAVGTEPITVQLSGGKGSLGKDGNLTAVQIFCDETRFFAYDAELLDPEFFGSSEVKLPDETSVIGHVRKFPATIIKEFLKKWGKFLKPFANTQALVPLIKSLLKYLPYIGSAAEILEFIVIIVGYVNGNMRYLTQFTADEETIFNLFGGFLAAEFMLTKDSNYNEKIVDFPNQLELTSRLFEGFSNKKKFISIDEIANASLTNFQTTYEDYVRYSKRYITPLIARVKKDIKNQPGLRIGPFEFLPIVISLFVGLLSDDVVINKKGSLYYDLVSETHGSMSSALVGVTREEIYLLDDFFKRSPVLSEYQPDLMKAKVTCEISYISEDCLQVMNDLTEKLRNVGISITKIEFLAKSLGKAKSFSDHIFHCMDDLKKVLKKLRVVFGEAMDKLLENESSFFMPLADEKFRLLEEVKLIIQKIFLHKEIKSFRVFGKYFDRVLQKLLDVFKRVDEYDYIRFIYNFLSQVQNKGRVSDKEIARATKSLNKATRIAILSAEMEKTKEGFNRMVFPFGGDFSVMFPVRKPSKWDRFLNMNKKLLDDLKTYLINENEMCYDQYLVKARFEPLYIWHLDGKQMILTKFLKGNPMELYANILNGPLKQLFALKCTDIRVKFFSHRAQGVVDSFLGDSGLKITHSGRSYFRFGQKIYRFDGGSINFYQVRDSVSKEGAFKNLEFSPYTVWKFQLDSRPLSDHELEFLSRNINYLALTGKGSYVDGYNAEFEVAEHYVPVKALMNEYSAFEDY